MACPPHCHAFRLAGYATLVAIGASGGHKLAEHEGELAIYSENFDRYPLDPMLMFTLKKGTPR
ncbi:MAG: hypothetical protein HQ515_07210 [Phycisphaeraceae bacterium]|nr:hypothetical protein [Phycisphaeraceae bacterium]